MSSRHFKSVVNLKEFKKIPVFPDEAFSIRQVEKILNYEFRLKQILLVALTHRSYINILKKHKQMIYNNERIEFLGDAVLEFLISEYLFKKYSEYSEGVLTLIRAASVRTESLAEIIVDYKINDFILIGPGEEKTGGRQKPYILANMYEALLGAIYLDGGIRKARAFFRSSLEKKISEIVKKRLYIDPKTYLQELTQRYFKLTPTYEIIRESGLAHAKEYEAVVKLNNRILGKGVGPSKQRAEEEAAKEALKTVDKIINKGEYVKD